MWRLLNSRKVAVYLLAAMTAMLVLSSFLPSYITLGDKGWYELREKKPTLFWVASRFSTPFLVTHPVFLVVSLLLFLSTLVCTISRITRWYQKRDTEFSKEKAFSFFREERSSLDAETLGARIGDVLRRGRWEKTVEQEKSSVAIAAQKGMSGFWGSIVFHIGLLICFFAGPVSVLTTFRGELVIPEQVDVPLRQGFASHAGKDPGVLPDVTVRVDDFRAEYFEGKFKYDFRGVLAIQDSGGTRHHTFAVNEPVVYQGYQFTLHEYGYSPHVIMEKEGKTIFDYYLNLRHPEEGDSFEIVGEPLRALIVFFPDFIKDGKKIGTKSKLPDNPVVLMRLLRGDAEVFKGLFQPGDRKSVEGYDIVVPDYRYWVNLIVVRESGLTVVIVGCCIGLAGLLMRFLSNERRIEFFLSDQPGGTQVTVKGYSRYYPAFLEKEVVRMAGILREDADVIL